MVGVPKLFDNLWKPVNPADAMDALNAATEPAATELKIDSEPTPPTKSNSEEEVQEFQSSVPSQNTFELQVLPSTQPKALKPPGVAQVTDTFQGRKYLWSASRSIS